MADSAVAENQPKHKAAEKAAPSDKGAGDHAATQASLHMQPSNAEMQAHTAASKTQDKAGGGKLDASGHMSIGDTASIYSSSSTKASDGQGEKAAAAAAAPEKGVKPGQETKPNGDVQPGQEVKPDTKSGADAARDLKEIPGAPPRTRENDITYSKDEKEIQKVQEARQRLENIEKSGMRPDLKEAMKTHMDDLEHRNPPATADQIAGVYNATSDLLENKGGKNPPVLNDTQRQRLASDILSNAAQQHEIDQGMHNTCNVTTLEETLNRQSPDKAARMVADVGIHGEYKSPSDGKTIYLDQNSIKPDGEANIGETASKNGDRNYASQVFDMAAVNDHWQRQNPPAFYTQTNRRDGQGDTGERLMYPNGQEVQGPDGRPMRQPGLGTKAMAEIGKRIGIEDAPIISTKQFQGSSSSGSDGELRAGSYEQFKDALSKNKNAIVFLNGHDSLFTGNDSKGGNGKDAAGHVVTVSDYKEGPPAQVYMRNQWGAENNKWVSVEELYKASMPPGQAGRFEDPTHVDNNVDNSQKGQNVRQDGHDNYMHDGQRLDSNYHPGDTYFNNTERTLTDDEMNKWQQKIKDEAPPEVKAPKHQIDFDSLSKLLPKLEAAKQSKDDATAASLQSQIDQLLNGN